MLLPWSCTRFWCRNFCILEISDMISLRVSFDKLWRIFAAHSIFSLSDLFQNALFTTANVPSPIVSINSTWKLAYLRICDKLGKPTSWTGIKKGVVEPFLAFSVFVDGFLIIFIRFTFLFLFFFVAFCRFPSASLKRLIAKVDRPCNFKNWII